MTYYVGILDGDKDVWGVSIPDVPGCYGGGITPEDAVADAIGALREVAAHCAANGIALSAPRSVRDILHDESVDLSAAESVVMIPLLLDRGRSVKANISLDAGLLEAIDEEAERMGLTRSSFLASAAVDKIEHIWPRSREQVAVKGNVGRTVQRGSKGTKLYAVRDKKGQLGDIQTHKRDHSADIRRRSKKEKS